MKTIIEKNLVEAIELLKAFLKDHNTIKKINEAGEIMSKAIKQGNKIISCGNGGSMTDAMHFAEELTGRFRDNRESIPAIAISDPGYLSCAANDFGYDKVFSRFLEGMGNKGDILLGISTSGNSSNVINAAKTARKKGITVIGLTGKDGGELASECDIEICVPHFGYADRIQEIHIKIIHTLVEHIESSI